jgi:hypothetical protein
MKDLTALQFASQTIPFPSVVMVLSRNGRWEGFLEFSASCKPNSITSKLLSL